METNEDKTFERIVGKIVPESVYVTARAVDAATPGKKITPWKLGFELATGKKSLFFTTEKLPVMMRFSDLFGFSFAKLRKEWKDEKIAIDQINKFVKDSVKDKDRSIVVLLNKENRNVANVVSERHKQIALTDVDTIIREVVTKNGFKLISSTSGGQGGRRKKKKSGENVAKKTEEEGDVWDEFGISEKRYFELERQVKHAELDSEMLGEFCKRVFPDSKENQVRAFILCMRSEDWLFDEEDEAKGG